MVKFIILFFSIGTVFVHSQNWQSLSHVQNHQKFFTDVLQEMVEELERREWCNLKLDNVYQTISDSLYNFVVNGTVVYNNGFLISIQKMNLVNIQSSLSSSVVDDVMTSFALVRGNLNLHDVTVGFDVEATLFNDGVVSVQKYTGTFTHILAQFQISIQKNLNTEEISVFSSLMSLQAGSGVRMIYMPANNVTQALSRRWLNSDNWTGLGRWGTEHFVPIVLDIVNSRIPFPGICIGCYS